MPKPTANSPKPVASWSRRLSSEKKPRLIVHKAELENIPRHDTLIVFKLGKNGTIEQAPFVAMSGFRKALHILSGRAMFNKEAAKCYVRAIEEKLKTATFIDSAMEDALKDIKKELKLHPMTYGISSQHDYTLRSKLGETVDP